MWLIRASKLPFIIARVHFLINKKRLYNHGNVSSSFSQYCEIFPVLSFAITILLLLIPKLKPHNSVFTFAMCAKFGFEIVGRTRFLRK